MKRTVLLVVVLLLAFTTPAMARGGGGGHGGNGDNGDCVTCDVDIDNDNKNTNFNTNMNFNTNKNDVDVDVINRNLNTNVVDVDNKNMNFNSDFNTNRQDQEQQQQQQQQQFQGQDQGQYQGQNNRQTIAPTQKMVLKQTYNEAENKRNLPTVSGSAYSARGPEFRSEPNQTGNVQESYDILQVRSVFTLRMLKALERGEDLHVIVKAYRDRREELGYPKRGYKGMPDDVSITIIAGLAPDMSKYDDIAHLTVIGETDTTTAGSIAAAAVEAIRHGSDTLLITGEGSMKVLQASGWGIMLGGSGSLITSDTNNGAVGAVIAPGIGYASAKTAYGFSPHIQAFGLKSR